MDQLQRKLDAALLDSDFLLSGCKLLDVSSRETPEFKDRRNFPFYYYLGTQIAPKRVLQIGPQLGLIGACFLQGCKTVQEWMYMVPLGSGKSPRNSNIAKYLGKNPSVGLFGSSLKEDPFDLAILSQKYEPEEFLKHLEYLWFALVSEGLLVVDYIDEDDLKPVFERFCRGKNREAKLFNTRYGVGILTR